MPDIIDTKKRNFYAVWTMLFGTIVNAALFGVKLWIGLAANNISIVTDAINNLGDIVSCILSMICFFIISKNTKTERYPHGLGRLEPISSLIMSMIIVFIGGYFFISALNRLMLASLVLFKWTYFIILLVTVFIKIGLAVMYKLQNKKIRSDVLQCCYMDSILDAAITLMTVIGLLLTKYVQFRFDGIFGAIVSTFMIVGGIKLFITNLRTLLGTNPDKKEYDTIINKLYSTGIISEIYSTEYHDYGPNERELLINALFTTPLYHDIIENTVEDINKNFGIKIIFIIEVNNEKGKETT